MDICWCCSKEYLGETGDVGGRFTVTTLLPTPPPEVPPESKLLCSRAARAVDAAVKDSCTLKGGGGREKGDKGTKTNDLELPYSLPYPIQVPISSSLSEIELFAGNGCTSPSYSRTHTSLLPRVTHINHLLPHHIFQAQDKNKN